MGQQAAQLRGSVSAGVTPMHIVRQLESRAMEIQIHKDNFNLPGG
jgi:hypothetical protein